MIRTSSYVITVFSSVFMTMLQSAALGDQPTPSAVISSDEQRLLQELRSTYPTFGARLNEAISNVQCSGKLSLLSYDANVIIRLKEEQGQIELTYTKLASELNKYPKTHIRTRTGSFSYDLAQTITAGQMQPERVKPLSDDRNAVERWRRIERWIAATMYVGHNRLGDLLQSPSFVPTHAEEAISDDGQRSITVQFEHSNWYPQPKSGPRIQMTKGEFTVIPSLDWAISSYALHIFIESQDKPNDETAEIKLSRMANNDWVVPVSGVFTLPDGSGGISTETMELQDFSFGKLKDEQFLPSHFGLPDTLLTPPSDRPRFSLGVLACLTFLSIVATFLLWRSTRKSQDARHQ